LAAAASSAPSARNILSHIERLLEIRAIGISFEYGRKVHQNRLLRLAREGAQTASRILKERSNNSQCRAALKDFQPNQTIEFEPGRTRSRRLSGEHPRGTELKADLCLGGGAPERPSEFSGSEFRQMPGVALAAQFNGCRFRWPAYAMNCQRTPVC
jgi:hypothetical protein